MPYGKQLSSPLMTDEEVARLRRAVLRLARRLRTLSTEEGLTPAQSAVLAALVREGPMRLGALAAAEGLHATMLSRMMATLEERGLAARRPDPDDRRAGWAEATPAGRRLIARLRTRHRAALADLLAGLGPEDVAALRGALPALDALAGTTPVRAGSGR